MGHLHKIRMGMGRAIVRVILLFYKKEKLFFFLKENNYPNNYQPISN